MIVCVSILILACNYLFEIKLSTVFMCTCRPMPKLILVRPFFIIDWFTDPPTLLFGKLKKK